MKRVIETELEELKQYFLAAASAAQKATCYRAKCGSVIVSNGVIIGEGHNSPPLDNEANRTCDNDYELSIKPKFDKSCCVHAEWRAVLATCKRNAAKIPGSTLYFMRIDEFGNFTDAGEPYCTICSRLVMEAGVSYFALWNNNGADIYELPEYDQKSYAFYGLR